MTQIETIVAKLTREMAAYAEAHTFRANGSKLNGIATRAVNALEKAGCTRNEALINHYRPIRKQYLGW